MLSHRKPLGTISRAQSRVLAWLPNILHRGINFPFDTGYGGIIRDENGHWVAGFSRKIGITNSFVVELWGLRDGLIMCCSLNLFSLEVEVDAKAIDDCLR